MYTAHGHLIPGTDSTDPHPGKVARCGGIRLCKECKAYVEVHDISSITAPIKHDRLSADEFLQKLTDAEAWAVIQSFDIPNALELYVRNGEEVERFLTPNFLEMRRLEVELFFIRLNSIMDEKSVSRMKF